MLPRSVNIPLFQSFFLFGARGTGKSTLLKELFGLPQNARTGERSEKAVYIDLLDPEEEQVYLTRPQTLRERLTNIEKNRWIIIDEIQKVPKLLETVHQEIERNHRLFALTGSSARKLKAGGANLLAGRANVVNLHPLTFQELPENYSPEHAFQFGTLPRIVCAENNENRATMLRAYAQTYIKEEIWGEQIVRKIEAFRKFIEVVAQMNGKILNHSLISRDTNVDVKTIHQYFEILEDTLIGFHLEAFDSSFRTRLSKKPKFYFFDVGVCNTLKRTLNVPLQPQTNAFGEAFEHFLILEFFRLNALRNSDFRFSYLRTKNEVEIDLVIERPGKPMALVEIKSAENIREDHLSSLMLLQKDFDSAELFCLCREPMARDIGRVKIRPWQEGILELFIGT